MAIQVEAKIDTSGVPRPEICPYRTAGSYVAGTTAAVVVVPVATGVEVVANPNGDNIEITHISLIHSEVGNDFALIYDGGITGTLIWKKDLAADTAYNEEAGLKLCTSTGGVWFNTETNWEDGVAEKLVAFCYRKWKKRTI